MSDTSQFPQIYYAHHIYKYNTEIERYEQNIINAKFGTSCTIFNPSKDIEQERNETQIMDDCLIAVLHSEIVVFSSLSGVVGKGVVTEVEFALKNGKKVYYLNNNKLKLVRKVKFKRIQNQGDRIYALVKCK